MGGRRRTKEWGFPLVPALVLLQAGLSAVLVLVGSSKPYIVVIALNFAVIVVLQVRNILNALRKR